MSSTIKIYSTGAVLPLIYKKLDNEERPYELIVSRPREPIKSIRVITLKCNERDYDYFKNLLSTLSHD